MYMGHFLVARRAVLDEAGWFRQGFDGCQDYDLVLRITDAGRLVRHIPRVLYHWRKHTGSTAADPTAKPYTQGVGLKALSEAIARRSYPAVCENGQLPNTYQLRWRLDAEPKVSLIICSRDVALLRRCLESVRRRTSYRNYELVLVEHGIATDLDAVKVRYCGSFDYARMNNEGAAAATGDVLIFLNDDVEPLSAEWMYELVAQAQRPEVGIVGAKLVYPSGAIQHAGLVIGIMDGVGHLCRDTFGIKYWSWLPFPRNVSAVTGACLAIRKDLFDQLGGFDTIFPINYNDADLCLRARQRGYAVIYESAARLRHYECRSRKPGVRYSERQQWHDRWACWLDRGDPFYNPNLAHNREDASLELEIATCSPEDNCR
jgi:GT2 family glycosyltransferase